MLCWSLTIPDHLEGDGILGLTHPPFGVARIRPGVMSGDAPPQAFIARGERSRRPCGTRTSIQETSVKVKRRGALIPIPRAGWVFSRSDNKADALDAFSLPRCGQIVNEECERGYVKAAGETEPGD
jgi:hypothetical protein